MAKQDDRQQSAAVRQALAERDQARELGLVDAEQAAEKRLAAAGYTEPADEAPKVTRTTPPAGRETRQERASRTAPAEPARKAD